MAYNPDKRKSNPWYKFWKFIFRGYLWMCGIVILGNIIPPIGVIAILPFYVVVFTFPLFFVSFVALYTFRENDRERARIYDEILRNREAGRNDELNGKSE